MTLYQRYYQLPMCHHIAAHVYVLRDVACTILPTFTAQKRNYTSVICHTLNLHAKIRVVVDFFFFPRREPHTKQKKVQFLMCTKPPYTMQLHVCSVKVVNIVRATSCNAWAANTAIEWLLYNNVWEK